MTAEPTGTGHAPVLVSQNDERHREDRWRSLDVLLTGSRTYFDPPRYRSDTEPADAPGFRRLLRL